MKCLVVRQPWVWAIFHGGKPIENRSRAGRIRGRVVLQASGGMTRGEYDEFVGILSVISPAAKAPRLQDLVRGVLYGTVNVVDCVSSHPSQWFFGPYGYVLENPIAFKNPVPWKGQRGWFDIPDDLPCLREAA